MMRKQKKNPIQKNNMNNDEIIKNRFNELPPDIKQAIMDSNLASKFDSIAEKNNLRLDQNGNLQTETLLVMLGLENNSDYIDNIQKALEIKKVEAINLAKDVNEMILNPIRDSLRIIQEVHNEIENSDRITDNDKPKIVEIQNQITTPTPPPTPPPHPQQNFGPTKHEQEGQFQIEPKAPPSSSPLYNDTNLDREAILKEIEDAQHPTMIDHLLTTPINNAQKVEEKKVVEIVPEKKTIVDKKENQPPKPYTVDPYREPFA